MSNREAHKLSLVTLYRYDAMYRLIIRSIRLSMMISDFKFKHQLNISLKLNYMRDVPLPFLAGLVINQSLVIVIGKTRSRACLSFQ